MLEIKRRKLCTKENALVNKFDEVETKVPMHISDLPVEMFHRIYQFLPDKDLENCLEVNLQWHYNANDIPLWKARCRKYGVEDEGEKTELAGGKFENLCRPARIWFAFRNSPAYRWRTNSPKVHKLKYNYRYQLFDSGVKFLSNRRNYIENLVKLSQPEMIYELNPALKISRNTFMGKKFFVFNYNKNVLLIFKFEGSNLNFHFAIGLKNYQPYVIDSFDEERFRKSACIISYGKEVIDDLENLFLFQVYAKIQINDRQWRQYWIDLRTQIISPMVLNGGYAIRLTENDMIVDASTAYDYEITVYDHKGCNSRIITGIFFDYKANNNVFLGTKSNDIMESWDIKTGILLQSFQNVRTELFNCSAIHPTLEIAYLIQESNGVKAINLRTGETIWENNDMDIVRCPEVFCGKYLVEDLLIRGRKHFKLVDVKDGSCLFQVKCSNLSMSISLVCEDYILLRNLDGSQDTILSYLP